jgi:hypothetical protein
MKANRGPKPSDTFKKIRTSQKPGYFPGREPLALTEPKSLAERTHQNVEARLVRTHQDGETFERHLWCCPVRKDAGLSAYGPGKPVRSRGARTPIIRTEGSDMQTACQLPCGLDCTAFPAIPAG